MEIVLISALFGPRHLHNSFREVCTRQNGNPQIRNLVPRFARATFYVQAPIARTRRISEDSVAGRNHVRTDPRSSRVDSWSQRDRRKDLVESAGRNLAVWSWR